MDSPLHNLIQRLAHGEPTTLESLAAEMDISSDLLDMMLDNLERAGYIQPVAAACSHNCTTCASRSGCGLQFKGRLWAVTAKGFQYVGHDQQPA